MGRWCFPRVHDGVVWYEYWEGGNGVVTKDGRTDETNSKPEQNAGEWVKKRQSG